MSFTPFSDGSTLPHAGLSGACSSGTRSTAMRWLLDSCGTGPIHQAISPI